MVEEEKVDLLAERLVNRIEKANEYILKRMGENVNKIKKLTPTEARRLINILKYGGTYEEIVKKLAEYTDLDIKDIDEIFKEYAKEDQMFYKQFYQYKDIPFVPYENNYILKNQTQALANIAKNEMYNFTRDNILGYTIRDLNGNVTFKGIRETYNELLDNALINVSQGTDTFDSAMTHILKEIGSSGIKTLQYQSGRAIRLDSAVRMHLKSRINELHNENQKLFGNEFGFDGWEISVHGNPAPDHQDVQGRQFTIDEYNKLQAEGKAKDYKGNLIDIRRYSKKGNMSYRPISEMNCYHKAFPIVLGVSEPEYTDEQLEEIKEQANDKFQFDGKEYSKYESTQLQRMIERKVREQKDTQILAKETGNKELIKETQTKITHLTNKYRQLSNISGIPTKMDRMKVSGYRKSKVADSKKAINYKIADTTMINKMQEQSNKYWNNISETKKDALRDYSGQWYKKINKDLVKSGGDFEKLKDVSVDSALDVKVLDAIMNENKISDNIITFKGTSGDFYEKLKIGDTFTLDFYNSTSLNKNTALGFNEIYPGELYEKPSLLEIRTPKNTKGFYIGENSKHSFEKELLLNRGLKYELKGTRKEEYEGREIKVYMLEVIK